MLNLSTIKPAKGATKKRKTVGRGNSSGHGTYSCRGMKGQKARSGVSGLKRLGMKNMILQIPKSRGFKSKKPNNQIVDFSQINSFYKTGESIDKKSLFKNGLIVSSKMPVKILGEGDLNIKNLKFIGLKVSVSAKEMIAKNNGEIL